MFDRFLYLLLKLGSAMRIAVYIVGVVFLFLLLIMSTMDSKTRDSLIHRSDIKVDHEMSDSSIVYQKKYLKPIYDSNKQY